MKNLYVIFLVLLVFSPFQAKAAEWYLDLNSAGENNGTSWENAWQHIQDIDWQAIKSGETLLVNSGDYDEELLLDNVTDVNIKIAEGALQAAIFTNIKLFGVNNILIDGWKNNSQYFKVSGNEKQGIRIVSAENVIVRGVEVDRSSVYQADTFGVHCVSVGDNSDYIVLENNNLHDTTGDGINASKGPVSDRDAYDSFLIRNNRITNVGDDGIQGPIQASIYNNYIDKNNFPTYFGAHPDGYQSPNGNLGSRANNIKIYNNTFKGFSQNVFIEYVVSDVMIYNNSFIGTRTVALDRGLAIEAKDGYSGDLLIANNVFYNFVTQNAISGGKTFGQVSDLHIGNNIFLDSKYIINGLATTYLDDTNIYWDSPGIKYYNSDGEIVETPLDRQNGGSLYIDPRFINLETFEIDDNSPAYDQGRSFISFFDTDKKGNQRPQGAAWDIGLHEYKQVANQSETRADVNGDANIDSKDIYLTFRKLVGVSMLGTSWQESFSTGDVNCDDRVNIVDALLIFRYTLGLNIDDTAWCDIN